MTRHRMAVNGTAGERPMDHRWKLDAPPSPTVTGVFWCDADDTGADYTKGVIANNPASQPSDEVPRRRRAEKTVEITDPKAIRALAHAARLEVISELYATQVSHTATELAARTGLTPSAMSYHLRALQKWGIVAPAENSGDARERRWRAAGTDFTISGGSIASPEIAVLDLELDAFRRRASAFAKARGERKQNGQGAEEAAAVVLASNLLYLTKAQRKELSERIRDVLREYELEDPSRIPEGAERMATLWSLIPDDRVAPGH